LRAAGRRAGTTQRTKWWRAVRRTFARLDVPDRHIRRHPSRHSIDRQSPAVERWGTEASVTPLEPEHCFEDLLEEWGRSA
jgi:hypothetical protein